MVSTSDHATSSGEGTSMRYQFVVRDAVSERIAAALPELSATAYPTGGTTLFGPVRDEADVWSLLARIGELGLSVVDVHPLPD
jgi:hypothetical protein